MTMRTLCLAACAVIGLSGACLADEKFAAEKFGGTSLGFLLKKSLSNVTLSVSGPDDFHASVFSKTGSVALDLRKFGPVEDGIYRYQITAATDQKLKVRTTFNNGRDAKERIAPHKSVAMGGMFRVRNGKIVKPAPATKNSRRDQMTREKAK